MSIYEIMRLTNKMINQGIKELNKTDAEFAFERNADEHLKADLEYLGYEVTKVADLFNAKLPTEKFTREEMRKQKEWEKFCREMGY